MTDNKVRVYHKDGKYFQKVSHIDDLKDVPDTEIPKELFDKMAVQGLEIEAPQS